MTHTQSIFAAGFQAGFENETWNELLSYMPKTQESESDMRTLEDGYNDGCAERARIARAHDEMFEQFGYVPLGTV